MMKKKGVLKILADDKNLITYRRELNNITDSVLSSILLGQVLFRWYQKDEKPFFKFKEPCSHDWYKDGDSWCEELGFTRFEFDVALSKIATKIKKGVSKAEVLKKISKKAIILYWTDHNRVTWYMLNTALLYKVVNLLYIVNGYSSFIWKDDISALPINTKTTPETTTDIYIESKKKDVLDSTKKVIKDNINNNNNNTNNINQTDPINNKKKLLDSNSRTKKFIKPTAKEVSMYANEINFRDIDSEYFINYYESAGWVVGKNKPMRNWEAAVRTWKSNDEKYKKRSKPKEEESIYTDMTDYIRDSEGNLVPPQGSK